MRQQRTRTTWERLFRHHDKPEASADGQCVVAVAAATGRTAHKKQFSMSAETPSLSPPQTVGGATIATAHTPTLGRRSRTESTGSPTSALRHRRSVSADRTAADADAAPEGICESGTRGGGGGGGGDDDPAGAGTGAAEDAAQRLRARLNSAGYIAKFKLPPSETLLLDCSAALSRSILIQGRLYLSPGFICFYAKLFGVETKEVIKLRDVASITKRSRFVVGAEVLTASGARFLFTSFLTPTKTIETIISTWEKARLSSTALSPPVAPTPPAPASSQTAPATAVETTVSPLITISAPGADTVPVAVASTAAAAAVASTTLSTAAAAAAASPVEGEDLYLAEDGAASEAGFLDAASTLEVFTTGELPLTPTQAFQMFFSDNARDFCSEYYRRTERSEAAVGKWKTHEQFGRVRELQYIIPIKGAPLGPPTSHVEETQRLFLTRSHLVVECSTFSRDVPYAEYFRALTRFDVTAASGTAPPSAVRISGGLSWSKRTLLKGTITSVSNKQMKAMLDMWMQLAREWADTHPHPPSLAPSPSPAGSPLGGSVASLPEVSAIASAATTMSGAPSSANATASNVVSTTMAIKTATKVPAGAAQPQQQQTWVTYVVHMPTKIVTNVADILTIRDFVWLLLFLATTLYLLNRIARLESRLAALRGNL